MMKHLEPELYKFINTFTTLGGLMLDVSEALLDEKKQRLPESQLARKLYQAALDSEKANPWFQRLETGRALHALGLMLNEKALTDWLVQYPGLQNRGVPAPKKVAVVMAGNIPLVGFHDLLCVVISGHVFYGKPSSQDPILPRAIAEILTAIEPALKGRIILTGEVPKHADVVIATGSDNTARYFEYHFGDKPHIIRKNRNSTALISGSETRRQLELLGRDVFYYFGMGCRSVSHIFVPAGFDLQRLADAWQPFRYVLQNQKYKNNIDYQRAFFSVDGRQFIDLDACLLVESSAVASPVSVLHYSRYDDMSEAERFVQQSAAALQCIVTDTELDLGAVPVVPFGKSQYPLLNDYADGVDTMAFLLT